MLEQDDIHLPRETEEENNLLTKITVAEYMSKPEKSFSSTQLVCDVLSTINSNGSGNRYYPVLDEQSQLVGLVAAPLLKELDPHEQESVSLARMMVATRGHLHPDHSLEHAIFKMSQSHVRVLPVMDRLNIRELVGILSIDDIMRAQMEALVQHGNAKSLTDRLNAK